MLTALYVAAQPTRASELRVSLDERPTDPVASVIVEFDGHPVELRVLAASHQVIAFDGQLVETMAAGVAGGSQLTDGRLLTDSGWSFRAHIRRLTPPRFKTIVGNWRHRAMSDDPGLVAEFPEPDGAITGIFAERDGWITIHTYPDGHGGGTVVTTQTHVAVDGWT